MSAGGFLIAADMDLSLAVIEHLFDRDKAHEVARYAEYDWHEDAARDPLAEHYGLA